MPKGNKDSLDLIVERFEICTYRQDFPNSSEAILEAARLADTILYIDIYGALQFDGLVPGWDGEIRYPVLPEQDDGIAKWKPNLHITPSEYGLEIRWKPLDGMQQFDVGIEARKEGGKYYGVAKLVAYVWEDDRGFERRGCLIDIVNRNRDKLLLSETGTISIPLDRNSKEDIDHAMIGKFADGYWHILGFRFPWDEEGDAVHKPVEFAPIDLKQREEDGMYRDR